MNMLQTFATIEDQRPLIPFTTCVLDHEWTYTMVQDTMVESPLCISVKFAWPFGLGGDTMVTESYDGRVGK